MREGQGAGGVDVEALAAGDLGGLCWGGGWLDGWGFYVYFFLFVCWVEGGGGGWGPGGGGGRRKERKGG